jgi:sarcosine oxidase subunit alpha
MSQPFRLAKGGSIDRSRPILMRFDDREIAAFAGDTAASALLANGIHLVGRSFKYHRPRGILAHGSEEPNALLDVDRGRGRREPNNRATVVEAFDGLVLRSQNRWPSLQRDIGAINDRVGGLVSAGFYYKTFMWPQMAWKHVYEPLIRRAAGLGAAPAMPDPDTYQHRHAHCDVLVVGAGPAGLATAIAASEDARTRVILCDEQAEPGGALLHDVTSEIDGMPAAVWLERALATLADRDNVTVLGRTTAFGYFNHNHIALAERLTDHLPSPPPGGPRERLWQVRAHRVVLASGAHERPLVFADNDRPGVMLAESLRVYVNRYAVAPGRRIVIVTTGASAYSAALDIAAAGLDVSIIDLRSDARCGPELAASRARGIPVETGHTVLAAMGRMRVTGLTIAPVGASGLPGPGREIACDCVGMSGGWTPSVHLFSQSRGALGYDPDADAFLPDRSRQAERSAGACRGTYDLSACLDDGAEAGAAAAGRTTSRRHTASATLVGFQPVRAMPRSGGVERAKAFVDFQNDVTAKDLKLAVREGFESIEHVKRYTTTGMATDQGKTSNMVALGLVAETLGRAVPAVGTTTFRLPYTPVTFGAFAGQNRGRLFDPERTTPVHDWAASAGAAFEDVGLWKRAWYFPRAGEDMHAAVARECRAVRSGVGMFDASTLGKIEVAGPDAAEFLNRIYTNSFSKLQHGRCRYGLMLKEDGYIFDDGVVARLAPDRFHLTTTTGGAPRVLAHMEDYLQTEWPDLQVFATSITEQWAVIAVQGPKARQTIAPLIEGIDLAEDMLPHMALAEGRIAGIPCRLFRVSFTGEAGYEVNVPADYGRSVWEAIHASGKPFDITPYGTETMHVLRAEKGFIIVGQETDGTMTPDDVGLGGLVGRGKRDFVGKRSLARPDLVAAGRKKLVGLLTEKPREVLDEGAQIVADTSQPVPMRMLGHVTSSYWSECLGRSIALAVVADGRQRRGQTLFVTTASGFAAAKVVDPVFIDPSGVRLHA